MDKKLKVAVIGTGNWGLNHARVYSRSNVADLSCIVGRTELKAKERAEHFNVPYFIDVKTMLKEVKPDLVSVALPGMKCYEMLMELINEGVPILTEKPLTYDLQLAENIVNEAEKKNAFIGINFMHRYAKPVQMAYKAIEEHKIGKIAFAIWKLGQYGVCRNHIYENLIETQCHGIDMLEYLCGEIESVQAEMTKTSNRGYTTMGATFKLKNGAIGNYIGSYDAMERYHPSQSLEINGLSGRIIMKNVYIYPANNEITREAFNLEGLVKYHVLGSIDKAGDTYQILENGEESKAVGFNSETIQYADALLLVESDENSLELVDMFLDQDKSIIKLKKKSEEGSFKNNTFSVFVHDTHLAYSVANELVKRGYQTKVATDSLLAQLVENSKEPLITIMDKKIGEMPHQTKYPYMIVECKDGKPETIKTCQLNHVNDEFMLNAAQNGKEELIQHIIDELLKNIAIQNIIKADIATFRNGEINQYNLFAFNQAYFLLEASTRACLTLNENIYQFLSVYFAEEDGELDAYLREKEASFLICSYEKFASIRYKSKLYAKRLEYKILDQKEWYSGESIISFIGKKKCNLACKYCFMEEEQKENLNKEELSEDLIRAGLDFILEHREHAHRVRADYSLGGEPILSFDTYKKLWSIVKEYDEREEGEVALGFITNATLLDDEVIEWFNKNHHWIGFSLDGGKEVHDSMRVYPNGKGSFDTAYANIKKVLNLQWEHFPGVNAVLTAENPDILKIFLELWELGFRIITVKLVRADSSKPFAITLKNIDIIKQHYFEFAEFLIEKAKQGHLEYLKGILVPFDFFGRFLMRVFMRDRVIIKRCPGGERIFSIRNNGDIYPCDSFNGMDAFKMGNLKDNTFDPKSFVPEKVTEVNRCKDCWARYLCGGVCSYTAYINSHYQESASDAECELEKYLIMLSCYLWSELKHNLSVEEINDISDYIKLMTGGATW